MPDAVIAESEGVVLGVGEVLELDEVAVLGDSTGGEDDVVQADVMVASPRATARPTHLNSRLTLHPLRHIRNHLGSNAPSMQQSMSGSANRPQAVLRARGVGPSGAQTLLIGLAGPLPSRDRRTVASDESCQGRAGWTAWNHTTHRQPLDSGGLLAYP